MSQLTELIDKTIHAIQFNGCTLPESILRHQIENIVACAQLEESMRSNQRFLDSIGTAFGNGGNDRPNVDNHKGFIIGEVYKNNDTDALCYYSGIAPNGYFVFEHISFTGAKDIPLPDNFISKGNNTFWSYEGIEKEFNPTPVKTPNVIGDMITEPADYVNPITN